MSEKITTIFTHIIWHEITNPPNVEPDDEEEVLVYDGYLDDVVKGYKAESDLGKEWCDVSSGDILKDPQFWAEIPFPTVPDARPGLKID